MKQKITKDTYITDQEWIESHILDVITLALGYSEINEAEYALLGKQVYEKNPLRSSKYAEFYLKMLNKKSSYLPIVKGEYQGYKYEMSNYTDRNRLLLGVNCEGSCMDLFHNKGHETYEKVLLDKNADVVMITDQNNQFYGRILAFRKGNFVLLGPIRNKYLNHDRNEFDKNLVKHIALSILKSAMKKEDNLDFVFMANTVFYNDHHQNINDFVTLKDERFATLFPHADLDEKVLVLAHNPNKMYVSFDVEPKEEYFKTHPKINYQPTNEDVLRIIAINKLLQNDDDHIIKPFDVTNYYQVMVGEMWYLALRRDNTLEECLLPNADKVNVNEFVNTKMRLMDMIETNKFSL